MAANYAPVDDVKVQVLTQDGEAHTIEVPPDMKVGDFLSEIIDGLNLVTEDANHNRIVYVLTHKESTKDLDESRSLADCGVESGNHLVLRRVVTAGSWDASLEAR